MSNAEETQFSFDRDVIEASHEVPVVVDFWAPWCGPCRVLGPVLEKLEGESSGRWKLVKINTDRHPELAMRYRIQGIPAVKAFRDGKVVAEFVGALPENQVRTFLQGILPSPAEPLAEEAEALLEKGELEGAESKYLEGLRLDSRAGRILVGLARIAATRGDSAATEDHLARLSPDDETRHAEAIAEIKVALRAEALDTGVDELRARLETDPDNADLRMKLAAAAAARREWPEALDSYFEVVRRGEGDTRDEARKAMLDIFEVIGRRSELAEQHRAALARELYK